MRRALYDPGDIEVEIVSHGRERHYDGAGRKVYDVDLPKFFQPRKPAVRPKATIVLRLTMGKYLTVSRDVDDLCRPTLHDYGKTFLPTGMPLLYRECHPTTARMIEARAHRARLKASGRAYYRDDPERLR